MSILSSRDGTISTTKDGSCSMDDLNATAHEAGVKVRRLFNDASNEVSHASEKVTGEIRSNPVRSSLIALGMGVVLGALIRR